MKPSEAMLKGFEMANHNQCTGSYYEGDPLKPDAVCAAGACYLAVYGTAEPNDMDANELISAQAIGDAFFVFSKKQNGTIAEANDGGMSIPDIAGILAAEGY